MSELQRFRCFKCLADKYTTEIIQFQCKHRYCLLCLNNYILNQLSNSVIDIKCPMSDCNELISDSKIRKVISDEEIEVYEAICYKNLSHTYFQCLLPDCKFMVEYENKKTQYVCPNCTLFNCIYCQASHIDMKCHEYENNSKTESENICQKELKRAQLFLSEKNREGIKDASKSNLLTNTEVFECTICYRCIGKGDGIKLRNCFDLVCRTCLVGHIIETTKRHPQCPCNCIFPIDDREIKEILSEKEYEMYEKKHKNFIKPLLQNPFQCQAPDCDYLCEVLDTTMTTVNCFKCKTNNCVSCRAVHENENCQDYKLRIESTDIGKTNKMLEQEILRGELMECPTCHAWIENTGTCSLVSCSDCGLELCWAKQTSRWGPKGRGDTSGGCKCMVNGALCAPDCGGCGPS